MASNQEVANHDSNLLDPNVILEIKTNPFQDNE